jgi:S1-C subfamily serine protease
VRGWTAAVALALVLAASVAEARDWSWLGVRIRDLAEQETEELAKQHGIREGYGVVIVEVMEGSPAQRAGLKNGDIVVSIDERPVTDTRLLQRLIASGPVEREVRVTVLRSEGRRALGVRLLPMPRPIAGERVAAEFGFILRDPEPSVEVSGRRPGASAPTVTLVIRGSAAERAGLETGDVILQINETAVVSRDAAREALADLVTEQPFKLTVRRGERHLALDVPPAERVSR